MSAEEFHLPALGKSRTSFDHNGEEFSKDAALGQPGMRHSRSRIYTLLTDPEPPPALAAIAFMIVMLAIIVLIAVPA